jgi:predicted permease
MNAALFLVYNAVALRPLPVGEPDALVSIRGLNDQRVGGHDPHFSFADYLDYRAANQVFSGLAAHRSGWAIMQWGEPGDAKVDLLADGAGAGKVPIQTVSDNYFAVLRAELIRGRGFLREEMEPAGDHRVVVLSHSFWEQRLQSDPNIVGQTVKFDQRDYRVVGVTAPGFVGHNPRAPAAWMPLVEAVSQRQRGTLVMVGRLKPAVTLEQARADLDVITRRLGEMYPAKGRKTSVELQPGMKWFYIPLTPQMLLIFTPMLLGFAMVLMIACTNVANLLLARGVTRQQEIGVRLTLGAGRARIIRQLLTENFLLCAAGAVAGLLLACWFLQVMRPLILSYLPAEWVSLTDMWAALEIGPDRRVVLCTAALALVALVAAGLAPALHASKLNLLPALKDEGSAFGRRLPHARLRNFLVISQVAACLVLLSCAGLLVQNLIRARALNLGFDASRAYEVVLTEVTPPKAPAARNAWFRELAETLGALPGVEGTAVVTGGPFLGASRGEVLVHRPDGGEMSPRDTRFAAVTSGFFATFGVPVRQGRTFATQEVNASARVAIISETLARRLWPEENPLGKTIALRESGLAALRGANTAAGESFVSFDVIGVAGDVRNSISDIEQAFVYLPLAADVTTINGLFLRPRIASPDSLAAIARAARRAGVPLEFQGRLGTVYQEQMLPYLGLGALSGLLGGLALVLAAVGLYGVMSFSVRQRTREIGIRVALGATGARVVGMFVRQGMRLVVVGVVVGIGGSALFLLLMSRIWAGLPVHFDPLAFGAAILILGGVALLACWLPTRRATKVDPMVALRAE